MTSPIQMSEIADFNSNREAFISNTSSLFAPLVEELGTIAKAAAELDDNVRPLARLIDGFSKAGNAEFKRAVDGMPLTSPPVPDEAVPSITSTKSMGSQQ